MSFSINKKEEAKKAIRKLVEQFDSQVIFYKSNKYKEANVEDDFIKPFFCALNWNTSNEGLSPAQREVIVQAKGKKGKEPDYLLQLNGKPHFYIEAKHPKYKLWEETDYIWQAYSYAYSTQSSARSQKVDFSLLTDFEEFRFFDCTFKPTKKLELLNNFVVRDWRYPNYIGKFDELWDIFEKNQVGKGSLESLYLNEKKIKANRIPPDKAFLDDLDNEKTGWRIRLAKDVHKFNPDLDQDHVTAVVQYVLDRFIFIKVLSDREIEDDYLSQIITEIDKASLKSEKGLLNKTCRNLFEKLNKTYNGSIFKPREELDDVFLSNKTLSKILKELLPDNSRYNFKQIPVEILGKVYEEFLGKVVTLKNTRTVIEQKPEVRKAGGVYYTPQYIVDYIVENTVGEKLNSCKSIEDVCKIKICDPACGSGSFLLGAYAYLIQWTINFYSKKIKGELTKKQKEHIYLNKEGEVRLTSYLKRELLQNCIFGVDIDSQAVELAKTSLSLKMLEDTKRDELYQEVTLFHEQVLPNLDENIKCGNSLIGSDFYEGKNLSLFDIKEKRKINVFDWDGKDGFPEIMKAGGFDCVIGNPPYVKEDIHREIFEVARQSKISKYYQGKMDFWYFFTCFSIDILKKAGLHSFIAQNNWITSFGASILRNKILVESQLISFFDFNDFKVFENANIQTMIFLLKKCNPPKGYKINCFKVLDKNIAIGDLQGILRKKVTSNDKIRSFQSLIAPEYLINSTINFSPLRINQMLEKMENKSNYRLSNNEIGNGIDVLQDFVSKKHVEKLKNRDVNIGDGIFVLNRKEVEKYCFSERELKKLKPYYTSKQLFRYFGYPKTSFKILYADKAVRNKISEYPNFKTHLNKYKRVMTSVFAPYGLHRARNKDFFEGEKILSLRKTRIASFTYTDFPCYVSRAFLIIKSDKINIKYLTGLINSKLINFWLYYKGKKQGEQLQVDKDPLLRVPLIKLNKESKLDLSNSTQKSQHDRMISLVEQMLDTQKMLHETKSPAEKMQYQKDADILDKQIDQLVYELYELTPEEIKIVEGE